MPHAYTGSTLVTANGRLSRQLRREYDLAQRHEGLLVWESPDILPRKAWLERLWQDCVYRDPAGTPVLLGRFQEQALWEHAVTQSDAAEVSIALLDLPATAATAARAWELLHSWNLSVDPAECAGLSDPEAFLGWRAVVEEILRGRDWITAAELPAQLAARVRSADLPRAVAHAGFDELSPAERKLLTACGATEWTPQDIAGPRVSRVAFDSTSDELTQAACWARQRLVENAGTRVCVVVRKLAAQAAAVERIFDDVLHPGLDFARADERKAFHVSGGMALGDVPLIAAALDTLRLQSGLPLAEAAMLLCSPFLSLERSAAATLVLDLRQRGVDSVSLRVPMVRQHLPEFARAAEQLRQRQLPGEWSGHFSALLSKAGWPGARPLSAQEHLALEQWKELLSHLASLDIVSPPVSYGGALSRLRRIAREQRFARAEDDAPIQVMDAVETAGLRCDALWIAGMNANVWPEVARLNPFLPASPQRAAGVPHSSPERELDHARKVTARLLASAPEVVCSFARYSGEEALRASPLIEHVPESPAAAVPHEGVARRIFHAGVMLEDQPEHAAPPVPAQTVQRGGMSVLKDQAACPFRAFAIHRLGAKEPEDAELGISNLERGTVAHTALESFWREVRSQERLLALTPEHAAGLVEQHVNAALAFHLRHREPGSSLDRARALEAERWRKVLLEWLEVEKQRPAFEVVESERARPVKAGELAITIKADRVDRFTGDGTFAILDYKTSDKLSLRDWDGERPGAPQIPLYAVKSGYAVTAAHFAQLMPGKVKMPGLSGEKLTSQLEEWTRVVDRLGNSFAHGEAAIDPKDRVKTCRYCELEALCRIAELGSAETAEDDGE